MNPYIITMLFILPWVIAGFAFLSGYRLGKQTEQRRQLARDNAQEITDGARRAVILRALTPEEQTAMDHWHEYRGTEPAEIAAHRHEANQKTENQANQETP